MNKIILTMMCSAVVLPPFANAVTPLPEKVACTIADKQAFQTPDCVHLTGWIGSRIDINERTRLAKMDPERLLASYRRRPGWQSFDGEHMGKWLHAATLAWVNSGDPELRKKLDFTATELVKTQLDDGYLGTYANENRWTEWDVWAHKYNLLGLVTYVRYTGNLELLPACQKLADLLCKTFGDEPGKRDIITAGEHMGMAPGSVLEPIMLLYRLTGEPRYLDFAKYILRAFEQPNGPKIVSRLLEEKRVDKIGTAKAYEMLSCLNGMLEFYRTTGDAKLLEASLYAWQNIVDKKLYITGTTSNGEFFTEDYYLLNTNKVGETCATVSWIQFNAQLLRVTGEARFAEQLERAVVNQLFGAQKPDGNSWCYYCPMEGVKPYRGSLDGHCCLSSGPRGIALIPTFAASVDADGVVVNLYDSGTANLTLRDGKPVALTTETNYPSDGKIVITVDAESTSSFAFKARVPAWCHEATVKLNGTTVKTVKGKDGYATIKRAWAKGDKVELNFKLEPRVIVGEHTNAGKVAIMVGPLVLAADQALLGTDGMLINAVSLGNPDLTKLAITPEPAPEKLKTWPQAQVFHINALTHGAPKEIRLIPFADAGKLGGQYRVWLPLYSYRTGNVLVEGDWSWSRGEFPVGSINDEDVKSFIVSRCNKPATEDWFAVTLDEPQTIVSVLYAHGKTAPDGGWFDASAGKPRIQIQTSKGGEWQNAGELKDYPATTATSAATLRDGEMFTCQLAAPVKVIGVRVVGKPAGGNNPNQAYSSCAELQAFEKYQKYPFYSNNHQKQHMKFIYMHAMALIGLSAPLTFAADIPKAASSSGTGLVLVVNPVSYLDGRPYPSYRLNAVDQGMFLKYGEGPNQCDTMNAREAMINCADGTYYLYYDGVGAKGWVACLAESRDLKAWERKGPILEFGPGASDSAAACSPWIIKDEKNLWHMFYLGTPNTTGGDYKIPIAPYLAMRATSNSPAGPWTKRYDPVPFSTKEGTYYSMSAYPGHIIKQSSEYMMFFGAADAKVRRTISIARTKDLNGEWTLDPTPALPVTENLENTSMYFEPTSNTWFLFVNHIGNVCPDAVWVYWTNDINHWNPACKAIVLDGSNCTWSKKNIGMPTVVTVGDKLYVFYDGAGGDSTNEMYRSIGKATLQLPLKVLDPDMLQVPVMNGSFETPGAPPSGPSAKVGSPWSTIEAPAGFQQQQVVTAGAFTRSAEGGGEWAVPISADVTPDTRPLSQYLPRNVSPGDTLTVTFWLGRAKNTPGGKGEAYFDVSGTKYNMAFDTTSLPADSWKSYTLTQTITHSGSLRLGFYGTSKDNSWLDKISDVTVTPAAVDAKSPKCAGATLTTLEGKPKPLTLGDFGYSDPKSSPLTAVQITSLAPFGTLKLNGTPVDLNQIVAAADISKLSYQPDLNGNGLPYASIGFKAMNANNLWSRAASLLLNVTPVNDPPTSTGASALTRKGSVKTFAAADFPFSDVDTGDMLGAIKITLLPAHGTLVLSGKPITSVPSAAIPVANLEDLTYAAAADYTGADLFRYQVRDTELFSADATMALTVTSDIFVLNGSFEMPNPPTTTPGGPWGNLDSAWTNKLGNYARRRDSSTPPGGGLWILNLSDQGSWIEQDLGVSVDAGSTLSLTFSTFREDIFKSPNGGQGAFEASFLVGSTKYTELFDLSGDAKDTWVTKTLTKKIANTGNLSIRYSHVDTASTGDRITTLNANNGPGEIGRVAIDKVGNVSVKPKAP